MRRSLSPIALLIVATLTSGLLACGDDRSPSTDGSTSSATADPHPDPARGLGTPFTGEQLDRIDAGVRAQGPAGTAPGDTPATPRPLWVTNELRDDRMRLVVHVRLPLHGDLDNLERNQARCASVRERMRDFLLPGQRVELYLVFDDSVHACRDET